MIMKRENMELITWCIVFQISSLAGVANTFQVFKYFLMNHQSQFVYCQTIQLDVYRIMSHGMHNGHMGSCHDYLQ